MLFKFRTVYHTCVAVFYLFAFFCVSAVTVRAKPIPVKNHSPIWFGLLYPEPDEAALVEEDSPLKISVHEDYTSIFLIGSDDSWTFYFDMEVSQTTLDFRKIIAPGLEAGMQQPVFRLGGGFLDKFMLDFHSAFGFPDYEGQREAPRNRFTYYLNHNGRIWNAPKSETFFLGDTSIWLKKEISKTSGRTISFKMIVQPPVSSTSNGLGNGAWEAAAVLLLDLSRGKYDTNFSIGIVEPGYIDRGERLDLNTFGIAHASTTCKFYERWHFILQGGAATSPYSERGIYKLKNSSVTIAFGLRYTTDGKNEIVVGFLEDLSRTAPDFTIHISASF
ncbi:MAG: DUF3187 family protein [Nitrospinota bacterium]